MIQGWWRRWSRGSVWYANLNFARFNPLARCFFLYYLFVCILIECTLSSAGKQDWWWRYMTWVRTPGLRYSSHYFSTGIHVRFQCQGTAYTFIIHPPTCTLGSSQGRRLGEHHKRWSTLLYATQKSQWTHVLLGQIIQNQNLHIGTSTPPGLQFFYVLFVILFSLLF